MSTEERAEIIARNAAQQIQVLKALQARQTPAEKLRAVRWIFAPVFVNQEPVAARKAN